MKFAESVAFATWTNRLDFDEDPSTGKRILGPYLMFISRTDRRRTNDLFNYNLMFSCSFNNRWWLSGLDE